MGNRAVAHALQRTIDYSKATAANPGSNAEEMLALLQKKFGAGGQNAVAVQTEFETIAKTRRKWTPSEVWQAFRKAERELFPPSARAEARGPGRRSPTLPRGADDPARRQALRNFAFTSKTTLTAVVEPKDAEAREFAAESSSGEHAEAILMKKLEQAHEAGTVALAPATKITITINNSPCPSCATALAAWANARGLTRITVFFANPYLQDPQAAAAPAAAAAAAAPAAAESGKWDNFKKARAIMFEAGIKLHGFEPLEKIISGGETDTELKRATKAGGVPEKRFKSAATKLEAARGDGGFISDDYSEDEPPAAAVEPPAGAGAGGPLHSASSEGDAGMGVDEPPASSSAAAAAAAAAPAAAAAAPVPAFGGPEPAGAELPPRGRRKRRKVAGGEAAASAGDADDEGD